MTRSESISFDRVAHLYDETRTLPPEQMNVILTAFRSKLQTYRPVLEVGVGTGRFAVPLQDSGIPVIGVDISSRMVRRGLDKGLRNMLLADAHHLPFPDKSVDASYSIHVLHLVADWKRVLREIARVTRQAYYTVATYWQEGPTPYETYWRFLSERGLERALPGLHERKLPEILSPRERTPVGDFEELHEIADWIQRLDNRIFSGQWTLPDDVHAEAVEAVRKEFPNRKFTFRKRVELICWDVDNLLQV